MRSQTHREPTNPSHDQAFATFQFSSQYPTTLEKCRREFPIHQLQKNKKKNSVLAKSNVDSHTTHFVPSSIDHSSHSQSRSTWPSVTKHRRPTATGHSPPARTITTLSASTTFTPRGAKAHPSVCRPLVLRTHLDIQVQDPQLSMQKPQPIRNILHQIQNLINPQQMHRQPLSPLMLLLDFLYSLSSLSNTTATTIRNE